MRRRFVGSRAQNGHPYGLNQLRPTILDDMTQDEVMLTIDALAPDA